MIIPTSKLIQKYVNTTEQEFERNSQRASLEAFDSSTSPDKVRAPLLQCKLNKKGIGK